MSGYARSPGCRHPAKHTGDGHCGKAMQWQTLSFDNRDPVVQHLWLELSCDQRIQGFFLIRGRKEQKKIMLASPR